MEESKKPKVSLEKIPKSVRYQILALEDLYEAASEFVDVHFKTEGNKDRNIKILATMNQMIAVKSEIKIVQKE